MIRLKRIYDDYASSDGYRILIDRLWPRGIKKEVAHVDEWLKEIAPSTGLRKWFGHDAERFPAFRKHYREELQEKKALLQSILQHAKKRTVTLLYAAADEEYNHARVLLEMLKGEK